ncbi:hypothetical protein L1987_65640 [Smallanthus sonchifolius]|uniref:Uncharacterized protein n=1 Tax=Smallanthus sonchifolius TaxID=185202 RepID=A0ACB9BV92_9ASTR|nr:hypothetical protein L1987_65640 [Smallanthus sonchifolius]
MSTPPRNNLPPEIIEAILRLLPTISLGRFKSVSKTWHSLISNPQFIKTHLHQHHKTINEELNEIELPGSIANDNAVFNELVDLGGKLGLFGNGVGNDLWVMEEYGVGESWTRVCIDGVEIDPVKAVCLVEGSDEDVVLGNEVGAFVYNVDERRCRDVRIVGGPSGFAIGGVYVESLESPKRVRTTP